MSFRSSQNDSEDTKEIPRYIYQLPYKERKLLRDALDINNKWEELGGTYMKFDYPTIYRIGQAVMRNESPTDQLLNTWGHQNHTITELFKLLSQMKHYQAMKILKPFVNEKYHAMIYEGETSSVSQIFQPSISRSPPEGRSPRSKERTPGKNDPQGNAEMGQPSPPRESALDETRATTERRIQEMTLEACSPLIPYKELEIATNCWDKSNILGRGGFGVVFKGNWKNTAVAIKRLESQKSTEPDDYVMEIQRQQSLRELKYLNNYRHDNILPLYGYSIGGDKPCLIYQYMSRGSLEDRIQCRNHTAPLPWPVRVNIAAGAARGLQFLHGMDKPLIHGDIKSANILLDSKFEPKIGDFGLAKEGPIQQYTHVQVSRIHGTRPYLPDEFLRGKKLSTKVDTYSFGVVLCELATGLKAFDDSREHKYLRDHVHYCEEKNILKLIDMKGGPDDDSFYLPLLYLGKKCSSQLPKERPTMVDVLKELDNMLALRDVVSRARNNFRLSNMNPSNPLEAQIYYDLQASRRPSLAVPSGSHQLPHWLYPSSSPSKQPLHIALSTSPTHPVASQPFPVLPKVPEITVECKRTTFENVRANELNVPQIQVNPSSSSAHTNEANVAHSPDKQPHENRQISPQIAAQSSSLTSSNYTSETDTTYSSSESQKSYANVVENPAFILENNADDSSQLIPAVSKLDNRSDD